MIFLNPEQDELVRLDPQSYIAELDLELEADKS